MNKRRFFLGMCLVIALLIGGVMLVKDSAAQASPGWLSFDGTSSPAAPELNLLNANSQSIELQARMPGANTDLVWSGGQAYTRLSGEGYGYPSVIGAPELPVVRREVEIPFGATATLELLEAHYIEMSLQDLAINPIYPMQPPQIKQEDSEGTGSFMRDPKAYTQSGFSPVSPLSIGNTYIVRGHRILIVEVWPVAYDPVAGTLRLYSLVTFRISLEGSDMMLTTSLAQRYASPDYNTSLSQRVLNFNQGQPLPEVVDVGYLIITEDVYYDAMLPFVALRESRGFEVTMTRISELPGNTPTDIKNYIQTAYDTWPLPPSYVLLVGDTDTVPTWNGPEIGTSTDLYYGTVDGADWIPDIGRGRFPVRSAAQATFMVNKYLAYANLTGQEEWIKTASFPATCDNYNVAEGTHNYVINSYTLPGGWTGIFPSDPQPGGDQLYCVTHGANHQDLIDTFNQGRWVIIYSGHGSYDGWEMSFTPADVQNLTNDGMYPFVASHACLSGDFGAVAEVFGETWVLQENQGALVYWGSSTYSYWDEDDTLERSMFDSLFSGAQPPVDVSTMTDAGLAAVQATYPSMGLYYWETYNILGDPAVKLFLQPDVPTFMLDVEPSSYEVCTAGQMGSTIEISSIMNYSETVYLENGTLPVNVNASFDPAAAQAPFTSTLTLDVVVGAPVGDHSIVITATDNISITQNALIGLRIVTDDPVAPILLTPLDGSTDQPIHPLFTWEEPELSNLQHFQLADSAAFENILIDEPGLMTNSYQTIAPLDGGRCYWWQVSASNACGEGAWSDTFHFATVALGVSFFDDIENGDGNWAHQAAQGVDHWTISSTQSHSPTQAWHVPDDDIVTDSRLWNTIPISVGTGSTLSFWHVYQFEGTDYDGAVLEISTDGGSSWIDLGSYISTNGYNGTINNCCGNPLGGRNGWTGDLATWTEVTVDLSSFAGQAVNIRWRLGCDSSISDTGWYIDDVLITSPLPPNPSPILDAITPNQGNPALPNPVQVLGNGFIEMPSLRLGDTWLVDVTVVNSTTLTAVVPAGLLPGVYDLILYNGDCQEAILENAFTVGEASYSVSLPIVSK